MPLPLNRRRVLAATGAAALALGLPGGVGAAAREVGRVAVLLGHAHRAAAGGPLELQPGAAVREGDELFTGIESRLEIAFVDGTLLTLGPDSRVRIRQYEPEAVDPAALIQLVAGILKVAIGSGAAWQTFEVETETAVASVRATQWVMEATPEGSAVFVIEGQVAVTPKAVAVPGPAPSQPDPNIPRTEPGVVLAAGEGTDVKPGAAPTPPKTWGEARREAALARVAMP